MIEPCTDGMSHLRRHSLVIQITTCCVASNMSSATARRLARLMIPPDASWRRVDTQKQRSLPTPTVALSHYGVSLTVRAGRAENFGEYEQSRRAISTAASSGFLTPVGDDQGLRNRISMSRTLRSRECIRPRARNIRSTLPMGNTTVAHVSDWSATCLVAPRFVFRAPPPAQLRHTCNGDLTSCARSAVKCDEFLR
jgi:hypothetical protein